LSGESWSNQVWQGLSRSLTPSYHDILSSEGKYQTKAFTFEVDFTLVGGSTLSLNSFNDNPVERNWKWNAHSFMPNHCDGIYEFLAICTLWMWI